MKSQDKSSNNAELFWHLFIFPFVKLNIIDNTQCSFNSAIYIYMWSERNRRQMAARVDLDERNRPASRGLIVTYK